MSFVTMHDCFNKGDYHAAILCGIYGLWRAVF